MSPDCDAKTFSLLTNYNENKTHHPPSFTANKEWNAFVCYIDYIIIALSKLSWKSGTFKVPRNKFAPELYVQIHPIHLLMRRA
jgi:hypothetical protein